jgi:chondroitin 4-sulfotransferase 11
MPEMPVSHELKTIFIHIPKNAGESIEKTLGMYGGNPAQTFWGVINNRYVLQHFVANEMRIHPLLTSVWDQYFKFAVIRNPWSKAVSEYNWYLRYGPIIPFYEWVNSLENRLKINNCVNVLEIGHNVEQHKFVYDNTGQLIVDKLLRFENISNEFSELCLEKQWKLNLVSTSATASNNNVPFYEYYDELTALKISRIYAEDINKFGYDMNDTFSQIKLRDAPVQLDTFFEKDLYLDANPDVKEAGVDAYQHFLNYGIREQRRLR